MPFITKKGSPAKKDSEWQSPDGRLPIRRRRNEEYNIINSKSSLTRENLFVILRNFITEEIHH